MEVGATAGEGGPWGMALLALYAGEHSDSLTLPEFLNQQIFAQFESVSMDPDPRDVDGFDTFLARYRRALPVEAAAAECS